MAIVTFNFFFYFEKKKFLNSIFITSRPFNYNRLGNKEPKKKKKKQENSGDLHILEGKKKRQKCRQQIVVNIPSSHKGTRMWCVIVTGYCCPFVDFLSCITCCVLHGANVNYCAAHRNAFQTNRSRPFSLFVLILLLLLAKGFQHNRERERERGRDCVLLSVRVVKNFKDESSFEERTGSC